MSPGANLVDMALNAIGTSWRIEADLAFSPSLDRNIRARIHQFDEVWSRFHDRSVVSRMARATKGGTFLFPDEGRDMFALYDRLHAVTQGAVDPLVGEDLERLGYDAAYSLMPADLSTPIRRSNWRWDVERAGTALTSRRSLVLDVGAMGKGLLVDIITELLIDAGARTVTVDAGGDLRKTGGEPLRVGLEHPFDHRLAIGVTSLTSGAICGSSVGRRAWRGMHHVIDGRTGTPASGVVATWVKADTAMLADGLATALFFVSAEELADAFIFSHARMFDDGRAEMSCAFDGELFRA